MYSIGNYHAQQASRFASAKGGIAILLPPTFDGVLHLDARQSQYHIGDGMLSTAILKDRNASYGEKAEYRILPIGQTVSARAMSQPVDECRLFSHNSRITVDFYTPELASRLREQHAKLTAPQKEATPAQGVHVPCQASKHGCTTCATLCNVM